ncbi:MAG: ABC transporter permease [Sphingobacteriales bacterium]|nr:ABC transporter permease [Sphingobacteriales bacterium]MBP9142701.1 ABC transporter permease [Chitinophagales bacterium]MDA0198869.1 FtsX-like permease family protein [Bacteroidota bacterium]MBK6889771.1 ABC transporter permease [Sphingobacteriales bacterium]MBK7527713.1 ABC transporter permease [Sphingobacteriales bacterium]
MNLALHIARRYLISKKSTNAINIISMVSALGMMVGTAALVLVLSVFNGFEDIVTSLYNTFNPDIRVVPRQGKVFIPDETQLTAIRNLPGVKAVATILEENSLVQYRNKEFIFRLKGVDNDFAAVTALDTALVEGEFLLNQDSVNYAVLGLGVRDLLGVNIDNPFSRLNVFMPRRNANAQTPPEQAFVDAALEPAGVFAIQQEFDSKYIIVPIMFMRQLLNYPREVSALEIALTQPQQTAQAQQAITQILGPDFEVRNRYQQDALLYKVMRTEKWVVYLILTFILLVAAFNIVGSLSMLVLEKSRDIAILKSLGASKGFVRRIFFFEGLLLSLLGAFTGMVIAVLLCLAQQKYGLLQLGGDSFLIQAYPVSMRFNDFVLVFATVVIISVFASLLPANRAAQQGQLLKEA